MSEGAGKKVTELRGPAPPGKNAPRNENRPEEKSPAKKRESKEKKQGAQFQLRTEGRILGRERRRVRWFDKSQKKLVSFYSEKQG